MSFDLAQEEVNQRIAAMPGTQSIDPGWFKGFGTAIGSGIMRGGAEAARMGSMAIGGSIARLTDDLTSVMPEQFGGKPNTTEAQDKYFKDIHDDIFGRAVEHWTPNSNEVGVASNVVGSLFATLPIMLAAPEIGLPAVFSGQSEDLLKRGASLKQAEAVGAVQAAGLGLGLWLPILGRSLPERVLLGGVGFNVAQGLATRAAAQKILEGHPAAAEYATLDPTAITLDVLMGLAFGSAAHLIPSWREQGKATTDRLITWGKNFMPTDVDALAVLRQAQHKNVDSLPGIPVTEADANAHVERVNKAIEQAATDQPIDVQDIKVSRETPTGTEQVDPQFVDDDARIKEANRRFKDLQSEAERQARESGIPPDVQMDAPRSEIFETAREQLLASGRPPEESETVAKVFEAFYQSRAKLWGKSVEKFLERFPQFRIGITGDKALNDVLAQPENDRTIQVDGARRPITSSDGKLLGATMAEQTNFWKWFSDSKVVDAAGKPVVVYHGTRARDDFDSFFIEGDGAHFGTTEPANVKASTGGIYGPGRVMPLYLAIRNPKRIADQATVKAGNWDDAIAQAKAEGHDGLVYTNSAEGAGSESWVAFDPKQIKSAIGNRGTFDPNDPNILHQPAYHGSPHDFDQFSLDKIGTGEGAQAYGWGLYFAENPKVATGYQKALSGKVARELEAPAPTNEAERFAIGRVNDKLKYGNKTAEQAIKETITEARDLKGANDRAYVAQEKAIASYLEKLWDTKPKVRESKGALYQVDIPDEAVARMLDWDKPLSEQSPEVQAALKKAGLYEEGPIDLGDFMGERVTGAPTTGATLYKQLERKMGADRMMGPADKQWGPIRVPNDKAASEYLASIGIAGIKYFDEGSRKLNVTDQRLEDLLNKHQGDQTAAVDEFMRSVYDTPKAKEKLRATLAKSIQNLRTRNLVVFDDKLVTITHKDGTPLTPAERKEFLQAPAEGQQQPRGYYDPATNMIGLLNADPSTAIHEAGHSFLEIMTQLARETDAPKTVTRDVHTLMDWFGVKDLDTWAGMDLNAQRDHHEQFARGFEQYMAEGKAPNLELQGVFDRFKTWLLDLYKTLTRLNVNLTPEVRDVMGRMLAGDRVDVRIQRADAGGDIHATADSVIEQRPNLDIVYRDTAGQEVKAKALDAMEEARAGVDLAKRDARLFEIAAKCLEGA